jgi:hypothetical protein
MQALYLGSKTLHAGINIIDCAKYSLHSSNSQLAKIIIAQALS